MITYYEFHYYNELAKPQFDHKFVDSSFPFPKGCQFVLAAFFVL